MSSIQEAVFETGACQAADESEEENDSQEIDNESKVLSLRARLSSLLFVSTKPLTLAALTEAAGARAEAVEEALEEIRELFQEEIHGFSLVEAAGAFQLRTSPLAAKTIQKLIPPRARRLSRAAAESLAVIAYKQPVQKAEIEAIRGVDAMPTLKTLIDARLIRIVGRGESAGHPALYGTTQAFLEKFGLKDLSELPTIRELEELAAEPGEVEAPLETEQGEAQGQDQGEAETVEENQEEQQARAVGE